MNVVVSISLSMFDKSPDMGHHKKFYLVLRSSETELLALRLRFSLMQRGSTREFAATRAFRPNLLVCKAMTGFSRVRQLSRSALERCHLRTQVQLVSVSGESLPRRTLFAFPQIRFSLMIHQGEGP